MPRGNHESLSSAFKPPRKKMEERRIEVHDGISVSASLCGAGAAAVVLGHGAGGTRKTSFLVRLAEALAAGGRRVVLFNFPYSEARRRIPDPAPLLEATIDAVAQFTRSELGAKSIVFGGKSMGGRIASQAVAKGLAADGLVFLGYPLHPPGKPERLRAEHLERVRAPMLFLQGTLDPFARPELIRDVVKGLGGRATLEAIDGGDHSFNVRGRRTDPREVGAGLSEPAAAFVRRVAGGR